MGDSGISKLKRVFFCFCRIEAGLGQHKVKQSTYGRHRVMDHDSDARTQGISDDGAVRILRYLAVSDTDDKIGHYSSRSDGIRRDVIPRLLYRVLCDVRVIGVAVSGL